VNKLSVDSFSVDIQTVSTTTAVIAVSGRLDAARCPELRELTESHSQPGLTRMTINLRDAHFVDSVGLAALVKAMRDTQAVGATFDIVKPSNDDAMRIFRLSKFDEVFDMRDAT
jgi:anti-sigma B factor antagonist